MKKIIQIFFSLNLLQMTALAAPIEYECTLSQSHNGNPGPLTTQAFDIMTSNRLHLRLGGVLADVQAAPGQGGAARGITARIHEEDSEEEGAEATVYEPVYRFVTKWNRTSDIYKVTCTKY